MSIKSLFENQVFIIDTKMDCFNILCMGFLFANLSLRQTFGAPATILDDSSAVTQKEKAVVSGFC